jgi:predicted transcriptional regulator
MTTLTIRLPDELRDELETISKTEHKAVSDIVRESIRRHVAIQRFRALRRKVLPFAEAQGLISDDDLFKAIS